MHEYTYQVEFLHERPATLSLLLTVSLSGGVLAREASVTPAASTHTLRHTLSLTHTLTQSHTHTLSLTHSHTHAHSHIRWSICKRGQSHRGSSRAAWRPSTTPLTPPSPPWCDTKSRLWIVQTPPATLGNGSKARLKFKKPDSRFGPIWRDSGWGGTACGLCAFQTVSWDRTPVIGAIALQARRFCCCSSYTSILGDI